MNRLFFSIQIAFVSLFLLSCASTPVVTGQNGDAKYLAAISNAEYMLAEWGTAAASPIAFQRLDQEKPFKLDMDKNATFYFDSARSSKSGGFSIQDQIAFTFGASAQSAEDEVQQQRFEEELAIYRGSQNKQEENQAAYEKALMEYQQQKQQANALVTENYQFCQAVAAEMLSSASALEDAAEKEAALKTAVAERNGCLDKYLGLVTPTEPQLATITNSFPTLSNENVPTINQKLSQQLSNRATLVTPQELKSSSGLSPSGYSIPDHEALRQAASNFWLQQMFEVLGNPKDPNNLFGVSMVSVNPGWRSREGYKAQIDIQGRIIYESATENFIHHFIKNNRYPELERIALAKAYEVTDVSVISGLKLTNSTVSLDSELKEWDKREAFELEGPPLEFTPISPTSMGQNTDLDSTVRRDLLISLSLAQALRSAGAEAQAEVFAEYARRQQRSASSVTALNSVNVYSYGDSVVGVEVGPQFQAADTQDSGNAHGEFLQKQTFPVLLVAKFRDPNIYGYRLYKNCPDNRPYCLLQPAAKFVTSHRWLPIEKPWFAFLGNKPKLLGSQEIGEISRRLGDCESKSNSGYVKMRCTEIKSKLVGNFVFDNLEIKPPEKSPVLTGVYPSIVPIVADSSGDFKPEKHDFIIVGNNLSLLDKNAAGDPEVKTLFPAGQKVESAKLTDDYIRVKVSISKEIKAPIAFKVSHKKKPLTTATLNSGNAVVQVKAQKAITKNKLTVIEVNGQNIKLPNTLGDVPDNVTKIMQALHEDDCKRMEKKIFKIGGKSLEIPEGYCDVPGNAKALLEKLAK